MDSDSDDSDAESAAIKQAIAKGRLANQFINVTYEDLLKWLHAWVRARQTSSFVHEWKAIFANVLPKHTYLRYVLLRGLSEGLVVFGLYRKAICANEVPHVHGRTRLSALQARRTRGATRRC